jgi:hypothetical protein
LRVFSPENQIPLFRTRLKWGAARRWGERRAARMIYARPGRGHRSEGRESAVAFDTALV